MRICAHHNSVNVIYKIGVNLNIKIHLIHPVYELCTRCRYVATPSGVFMMYPGTLLSKSYDPTHRDW